MASALSKEMLTTQNIPNKFKFSIGRKLIGISQRMKKTVLTVLTALVNGDVKSRNSILGFKENPIFFFFFHGNTHHKDFHSEGALTVYLDKKKLTKNNSNWKLHCG